MNAAVTLDGPRGKHQIADGARRELLQRIFIPAKKPDSRVALLQEKLPSFSERDYRYVLEDGRFKEFYQERSLVLLYFVGQGYHHFMETVRVFDVLEGLASTMGLRKYIETLYVLLSSDDGAGQETLEGLAADLITRKPPSITSHSEQKLAASQVVKVLGDLIREDSLPEEGKQRTTSILRGLFRGPKQEDKEKRIFLAKKLVIASFLLGNYSKHIPFALALEVCQWSGNLYLIDLALNLPNLEWPDFYKLGLLAKGNPVLAELIQDQNFFVPLKQKGREMILITVLDAPLEGVVS